MAERSEVLPKINCLMSLLVDRQVDEVEQKHQYLLGETTPGDAPTSFNFEYYRDMIKIDLMQKRLMNQKNEKNKHNFMKVETSHKRSTIFKNEKLKKTKKKTRKNDSCPHKSQRHYARGMCSVCYNQFIKA